MSTTYEHPLGQVWASAGGKCNGMPKILRDAWWMPPAHRLRAERMRQVQMLLHKRDREYFLDEGRTDHEFPPIKEDAPAYFVPFNLLQLVAQKMADLLFGESPNVTVDDDRLQAVIDGILKRSWIKAALQGAAVDCCASGDTYLEITPGPGRTAMIGHVPAQEVYPVGVQGPDQQYPAYVRYATEEVQPDRAGGDVKRYMLKTTYTVGRITRECYDITTRPTGDALGDKVSIELWPARRNQQPLPEDEATGLTRCNLVYVPNGFGAISDFDGLIKPQDALHAKHTQISRVIAKHADPKLAAAEADVNPETGNLPNGEVYFFKDVNQIPKYITWNAELSAATEDRKFALLAFCIASEMPPSLLGIKDDAVAETAAKMRLNAATALAKASRKATYWTAALELAIDIAIELETLFPSRLPIGVTLQDGLPTDMNELADFIATLRTASVISVDRALRLTEAETSLIDASTFHRAFEGGQWVERRLPIGEAMLKAMEDDKRFNALQLYQQRLERAFYRALGELRQFRKDRADRVDQDVDVGGEDKVRIEEMMSDRAPDEAIVEVAKAQAMPERSLAGESAGEPEPRRGSDEAPGADTEVETENEQTKPTPVSQVVLNTDVALSQVGANEPTAGGVPALYELDMLASNMRRLRRGLPVRYPQVA